MVGKVGMMVELLDGKLLIKRNIVLDMETLGGGSNLILTSKASKLQLGVIQKDFTELLNGVSFDIIKDIFLGQKDTIAYQ